MIHQAHQNKHSQPVVITPPGCEEYIELITAQVTSESLRWETGTVYERQAFKQFSKDGFQNHDYKWCVQIAVWLTNQYMLSGKSGAKKAIVTAAAKAANMYLAIYFYDNLESLDVLPFNVKQQTLNLLHEIPELYASVGLKTLNTNGEKGALMNNTQYSCPPGYMLATDPNGNPICVPLTGAQQMPQNGFVTGGQYPGGYSPQQAGMQGGYYQQPSPQDITNRAYAEVNQRRAMARMGGMQNPAYNQMNMGRLGMYPQQQPYGVNPGMQGGGFTQYSNRQQYGNANPPAQGNSGVGRVMDDNNQQRTPNNQNPNLAGSWQNNNNISGNSGLNIVKESDSSPYKPKTQTTPTQSKTTNVEESVGLKKLASGGYILPYTLPSRIPSELGIKLDIDLPIFFDSEEFKGEWILDNKKRVTDFKLKEIVMDYERHNVRQYFPAQKREDDAIDKQRTRKVLADVQKKAYIAQKLDELDPVVEGDVIPNAGYEDYKLGDPVEIPKVLVGNDSRYDYSFRALLDGNLPKELATKISDAVVNYEHQVFQSFTIVGDTAEKLLDLKSAKSYKDIINILDDLSGNNEIPFVWQFVNKVATEYVNNVLRYRFNLPISIQSFYIDFEDLEDLLYNEYGYGSSFSDTAKPLIKSSLYPYSKDDDIFVKEMGVSDEEFEVVFGTLSDVTILPISGDAFNIPVPVPEDVTPEELSLINTGVVSSESYKELYNAIRHRVENADPRASRIVFGTVDGQFFFVHRTASKDAFIISSHP